MSPSSLRGRIEITVIESAALRDNPLGDPCVREVITYLPPSYDASSSRRFPLVVILAPFAATNRSMIQWRIWEQSTFELYEDLLARGETSEAILISPDACNRWGGSQFLDSPATGRYQSHAIDELLAHADARFRTIPHPDARAIVGRSSGGFGALRAVLDRPGLFAAVGSHAGDGLFEVSIRPTFTACAITIEREGGLEAFVRRFLATGPRGGGDFDAIGMVASAAAYAGDRTLAYPHLALPFDPRTALPIPEIWSRFLAHDPVTILERDRDALRDLALVYLDAGDRDEHGLHFAARRVAELCRARGARVRHEEFAGGHRGTHARYAVSLPALIAALATE